MFKTSFHAQALSASGAMRDWIQKSKIRNLKHFPPRCA